MTSWRNDLVNEGRERAKKWRSQYTAEEWQKMRAESYAKAKEKEKEARKRKKMEKQQQYSKQQLNEAHTHMKAHGG